MPHVMTSQQPEAADARGGGGCLFSTVVPSVFGPPLDILFHVFRVTGVLVRVTRYYNISCSLQTVHRCWTYFNTVCLDWQDTVGETALKLSKAMPGQASYFQDHTVCFELLLFPEDSSCQGSVFGIKSIISIECLS